MFKRRRFPEASSRRPCCLICNFPNQGNQIWAQSGSDWPRRDKSVTFSDHNSVHFGSVSKMYWNVIWKGPRFVIFGGQSDTHRTQIWHPYSKHLNYTLHTQILAVGRPNTRTQPLLWAMLIRVTRLVAYLCTILSSPYTSNQFNETHLLSTVNQSRRRILRSIYLHDMLFFYRKYYFI